MSNYHEIDFFVDHVGNLTLYYEDVLTGRLDTVLVHINNKWFLRTVVNINSLDDKDIFDLTEVDLVQELESLLKQL